MSIVCIIQARLTSERLPNKVLLPLQDKTVLEHVYYRCQKSIADKVVIAIPDNSLELEEFCFEKGLNYFKGSENDVLSRYYECAKRFNAKHIIRITADCPVIDYKIINSCILKYMSSNIDFLTNSYLGQETFPDGQDISIIDYQSLSCLYFNDKLTKKDREHVLSYVQEHPEHFAIEKLNSDRTYFNLRLTLDYKEDYEFIKILYDNLYQDNPYFGLTEIDKFLENKPELLKINNVYQRNESYYKQEDK